MPIQQNQFSMLLFVAWRNIWRNPVRSLLTVSALSGGLIIVILYAALVEGMSRQMVKHATEISSGHIQVHRQSYIDDQDLYATIPWPYLQQIEGEHPGISVSPRLYAAALASTAENSTGVLIQAVDPVRETKVTQMLNHLQQGRLNFEPVYDAELDLHRHQALVGAQLAKNLRLQVGDELILVTQAADGSIGNALFQVNAVLKPLEPNFDRNGVLMSIQAFQDLMYLEDGFHELVIKLGDTATLEQSQNALQQTFVLLSEKFALDELGGKPVVRNWRQLNQSIANMLDLSQSMVWLIGFIVVALASLGMLNTMMMAIHERTHEFGILLAIGVKGRWLLFMVMIEAAFLSLIAALAGSMLALMVIRIFLKNRIDFSDSLPDGYDWAGIVFEPVMKLNLEPQHIVLGCLLMFAVTMVASLIPSWRTVKLKPAEII